jgi:hypothetical protein
MNKDGKKEKKKNIYTDHWPKGGSCDEFVSKSDNILKRFLITREPVSNKKVNRQLSRLIKALDNLTPDVVEILERREVSTFLWDTLPF